MQIYYPEKAALIKNFNQEVLWEHLLFVIAFFFQADFTCQKKHVGILQEVQKG